MTQSLELRLADDLAQAMRAGDEDRRRTLRSLRAAIKNAEIEAVGKHQLVRGESLDDSLLLGVLQKQAKQRRDSIEQYSAGQREDLAEIERRELAIIEAYLPQMLSEAEVEALVREQIQALGASGPADMGRVMGPLMQALGGRAEGKLVSATVRRLLTG